MKALNKTERAVLLFLIDHKMRHLDTPTFQEVADAVGIAARTVADAMRRLDDFGYVDRKGYGRADIRHLPNGAPFVPVVLEQVTPGHAYVLRGPLPDPDFEDLKATLWLAGAVLHRGDLE